MLAFTTFTDQFWLLNKDYFKHRFQTDVSLLYRNSENDHSQNFQNKVNIFVCDFMRVKHLYVIYAFDAKEPEALKGSITPRKVSGNFIPY